MHNVHADSFLQCKDIRTLALTLLACLLQDLHECAVANAQSQERHLKQ